MGRIRITVDTGFAGATHYDECEAPDDWDEMSAGARMQFLDDCADTAVANFIEAYAEYVED